jgi:hypothetical protein
MELIPWLPLPNAYFLKVTVTLAGCGGVTSFSRTTLQVASGTFKNSPMIRSGLTNAKYRHELVSGRLEQCRDAWSPFRFCSITAAAVGSIIHRVLSRSMFCF